MTVSSSDGPIGFEDPNWLSLVLSIKIELGNIKFPNEEGIPAKNLWFECVSFLAAKQEGRGSRFGYFDNPNLALSYLTY